MNFKFNFKVYFTFFIFLIGTTALGISFCSCISTKQTVRPYNVYCTNETVDFSVDDMNYIFFMENLSQKDIKEFSVVVSLYNSDGEPAFYDCDFITYSFFEKIEEGEIVELKIPLDFYFQDSNDETYFTDYFYVSKIVYSDNSVWDDPFGVCNM